MGSFLIRANSNANGAAEDRSSVSNTALPEMGLGGLRIDADRRGATGPLATRVTRQEGSITRFCGAFLKATRGRFSRRTGLHACLPLADCRFRFMETSAALRPLSAACCALLADNIFRMYGMRRSPFSRVSTTLYFMSSPSAELQNKMGVGFAEWHTSRRGISAAPGDPKSGETKWTGD
jgi:hypothetical protein